MGSALHSGHIEDPLEIPGVAWAGGKVPGAESPAPFIAARTQLPSSLRAFAATAGRGRLHSRQFRRGPSRQLALLAYVAANRPAIGNCAEEQSGLTKNPLFDPRDGAEGEALAPNLAASRIQGVWPLILSLSEMPAQKRSTIA